MVAPLASRVLLELQQGRVKAAAAAPRAQQEHRMGITGHFILQILLQFLP